MRRMNRERKMAVSWPRRPRLSAYKQVVFIIFDNQRAGVLKSYFESGVKYFSNNSSAFFRPSAVTPTDFALPLGLLIYPFSYNLLIVSQSNLFHANVPCFSSTMTRYSKARVISSTFSLSNSIEDFTLRPQE